MAAPQFNTPAIFSINSFSVQGLRSIRSSPKSLRILRLPSPVTRMTGNSGRVVWTDFSRSTPVISGMAKSTRNEGFLLRAVS
jgi:hypothetical protein